MGHLENIVNSDFIFVEDMLLLLMNDIAGLVYDDKREINVILPTTSGVKYYKYYQPDGARPFFKNYRIVDYEDMEYG